MTYAIPRPRRRCVRAVETILAFSARGAVAPAVAFVEAVGVAPPEQREQAIDAAAAALAAEADPAAAADEIVAAFFSERPALDSVADDGAEPTGLAVHGTNADGSVRGPIVGGQSDVVRTEKPAAGLPRRDERRNLAELEAAAETIARATLRNIVLARAARRAMAVVRRMAGSLLGVDRSAAMTLDRAATRLGQASRAAGTAAEPKARPAEEVAAVDAALRRGAGVEEARAIARFSREFDELHRRGLTGRRTRAEHIALNLRHQRATK